MRFAIVLVPLVLLGQDTGIVEGTVINSLTRAGISGVEVQLSGGRSKNANRYEIVTDASGAFRIEGIQAGEYSVNIRRPGFISAELELALRVIQAGSTRLDLKIAPLAMLHGRVFDNRGNAAAGVEVQAGFARIARTDEDGRFTIDNLEPGSYRLLATPRETAEQAKSADGDRFQTMPTYFPSVVDAAQAEQIHVAAGDNLSGFEIRLRSAPVYRVRGVVTDDAGKPVASATVHLVQRIAGPGVIEVSTAAGGAKHYKIVPSGRSMQVAEVPLTATGGSFEFTAVRSGEWIVIAETERERGTNTLFIGHQDVNNLQIRLVAPFQLYVEVDAGGLPPGTSKESLVVLSPVDAPIPGVVASASGRLHIIPGRYRIVSRAPSYYAVSASLGGRDVLDQIIDLQPGSGPLHVVFKRATGGVRGIVENGEGAAVIIWAHNPGGVVSIGHVIASSNGAFQLGDLQPDDYYIAAFDRVDSNAFLSDPALLQNLVGTATSIHVDDVATASIRLNVNRWPQ